MKYTAGQIRNYPIPNTATAINFNLTFAMSHQFPLNFEFNNEMTFDSFQTGDNQQIIATLQQTELDKSDACVFLWGGSGVGKSHLLQATCQFMAAKNKPVSFIPLKLHTQLSPALFEGLEQLPLVCIDDVESIGGNRLWEEGLFHLFNRMREKGNTLLVSGNSAPAQISLQLADLKSRLGWGLVIQIAALSDTQKIIALQKRARIRGMDLNDDVGRFLLSRYARDMVSLMNTLDLLDTASLSEHRRLTVQFVRQVLG